MAGLRRLFLPGQSLDVFQRGNNREPIFTVDQDYRFYLRCLKEATEEQGLAIHASALMTNHLY